MNILSFFKLILLLVVALSVTSCRYILTSDLKEEVEKLDAAKILWSQKNTGSYQFTKTYACYCDAVSITIFVANNQVSQVIDANNGEMLSLDSADTIDEIFSWIDKQLSEIPYPSKFDVIYDEENGYPVSIYRDTDENASDDETSISITEFSF
ncbi:DUF6174 domain-containing protein [Marinicellulosiphila megalodicopiae]|uniref:DUF6174 domain-containing protein n=1 Tax=Marinicellulosiphila megalodicopiae TaxID=2724896 RepID=UPI003BB09537